MTTTSSLLTPDQFAGRAVGVPWARWQATWESMDCFGLLVLWHREVLGLDIGQVPETDIATGFDAANGWRESGPLPGVACFMAWRDGAPQHCGVLLDAARVIHSDGADDRPGSVRVTRLRAMRTLYHDLRFYRFDPALC